MAQARDRVGVGGSEAVADRPDARRYVANRALIMRGVAYTEGEIVDVSFLPDRKISQFLDQRLIRPLSR